MVHEYRCDVSTFNNNCIKFQGARFGRQCNSLHSVQQILQGILRVNNQLIRESIVPTMEKITPHATRSSSRCMPSRKHNRETLNNLKPRGYIAGYTENVDTDNLVHVCFRQMTSNIWYPILPFDDNDGGDMSSAMGKNWELVLKVLVDMGYLAIFNSNHRIFKNKWLDLHTFCPPLNRFTYLQLSQGLWR